MSMSTAPRPYSTTSKATPATTAMVRTLKTRCSMAGIIGPRALAFGVMSEMAGDLRRSDTALSWAPGAQNFS